MTGYLGGVRNGQVPATNSGEFVACGRSLKHDNISPARPRRGNQSIVRDKWKTAQSLSDAHCEIVRKVCESLSGNGTSCLTFKYPGLSFLKAHYFLRKGVCVCFVSLPHVIHYCERKMYCCLQNGVRSSGKYRRQTFFIPFFFFNEREWLLSNLQC